ncbi:mechanosensitive ion channel family protein [Haloglomus halophilum]|uniref:mechanosensitive ion channel family protein n=1 Tax=Haloglomus halophilum TaxID=2962672 RepID=UPI0020C968A7|nr:mechanosensitive ion channel family protein [Haloglomus halophilum]
MRRPLGYASFVLAVIALLAGSAITARQPDVGTIAGTPLWLVVSKSLLALGISFGAYGLYALLLRFLTQRTPDKRRQHDLRNVLRLLFIAAVLIAVLGIITDQWVGVLFSLGVVGFAVTFALQQPLFSLIGWIYIMVKRPYQVGDRVAIEGTKGDVVSVDFLVTTVWEINGELVTSNQPSGRIVTLPNSVVLSSHVYNYSWEGFPYVWNELPIQVAYETELDFARELMVEEADAFLGDEMADHIAEYRERLAETPVELEVRDRPAVNIVQKESWVELRLRYLVHPRRGQRVRNELYERILERMNDEPERVKFPVSRNR